MPLASAISPGLGSALPARMLGQVNSRGEGIWSERRCGLISFNPLRRVFPSSISSSARIPEEVLRSRSGRVLGKIVSHIERDGIGTYACASKPPAICETPMLMKIVPGARKSAGISMEDLYFPSPRGLRRSSGFVSVDQNSGLPKPSLRIKPGCRYLPPCKTTNSIWMLTDCVVKSLSTRPPWDSKILTAPNLTTSSPGAVTRSGHSCAQGGTGGSRIGSISGGAVAIGSVVAGAWSVGVGSPSAGGVSLAAGSLGGGSVADGVEGRHRLRTLYRHRRQKLWRHA